MSLNSNDSDNEAMFERAVRNAGGLRVSDELPKNVNVGKNADFLFRRENVIAELKCLVHDPRDGESFKRAIHQKAIQWINDGKIPPFWGKIAFNIRDLPLECG